MKKMLNIITTVLLLCGCANLDVESLEVTDTNEYFIIDSQIEQTGKYGIGITWTEGLMPGKYVAIGKDKSGTYFLGPESCFYQISEIYKNIPKYSNGGVWIPDDETKQMQFFLIGGTEKNAPEVDIDTYSMQELDRQNTLSGGPTIAGGLGVAIGAGIVSAFIAADRGKLLKDRKIHSQDIIDTIKNTMAFDNND